MLNISENLTIQGNITIENRMIVNMSAAVVTEENGYPNISVSVLDKEGYKKNFEVCKQGVLEFVEKVLNKQYEAQGGGTDEIK